MPLIAPDCPPHQVFKANSAILNTDCLPHQSDCPSHQVFKANSAILNTLLTLLNERLFDDGATRECVPLLSAVAASNEGASSDGLPDCPNCLNCSRRSRLRMRVRPLMASLIALIALIALGGRGFE